MDNYLKPTAIIDSDNPLIHEKAADITKGCSTVSDKTKALFYFVRDGIKYNLYLLSDKPEYFKASTILQQGEGFCIQKAVLMVALCRSLGIPSRLHIAAIRNHLAPEKVQKLIKGNIFPTHGYCGVLIEDKWVKVAPTFDKEMCQKNRFNTVEFDGKHDAILPALNVDGQKHIEYVTDRGHFDDMPFDDIYAWRVEVIGAEYFVKIKEMIEARKSKQS